MGGRSNSKKLKRVGGELQIVPVHLDLDRPPTAGSPLKRCGNEINLNISQEDGICHERKDTVEEKQDEQEEVIMMPLNNSTGDGNRESSTQEELSSRETMLSSLNVPIHTAHSMVASTLSSKDLAPVKCNGGKQEGAEGEECDSSQSYQDELLVYSNNMTEERVALQSIPTFFHSQRRAILSSRLTISDGGKNQPLTMKQINTVITTATTLGLPGSVRGFSRGTPSPVWSLRNQMGTPAPDSPFPTPKSSSCSPPMSKGVHRSKMGDGDTSSSTPTGSFGVPPNSAATSGSDRPPFMLTFRRPKPLPRLRMTSTRGSSRQYSLPTTASTPNPVSQQERESPSLNARVTLVPDPNNNQPELDANNNEDEAVNDEIEREDDKKGDERERSLLSLLEKPVLDAEQNEVIAQQAEVEEVKKQETVEVTWNSGTSTPSRKPEPETTAVSSKSVSVSRSKSPSSSPSPSKSSYSKQSTKEKAAPFSCPAPAANAFLTTEKGAIRFHLPGRIQHKTTIKVAHFPVGEEKNITVNLKPDSCEAETEEEVILPNNFGMPPQPEPPYGYPCPPPQGAYPYPPYGYPPAPPQPYYYGYPPYY